MSSWNYKKSTRSYKIFSNYVAWQALTQAKCASIFSEAVVPMCSSKWVFLKISQISQGKHLSWSLFLIKLHAWSPANLLKRDSNTCVFLWKMLTFWKHLFYRTSSVAASIFELLLLKYEKGSLFVWKSCHVMFGGCPFFCK